MSFRNRVQAAVVLLVATTVTAALCSLAPPATAQHQRPDPASSAARSAAAHAASPSARLGASAGRSAGAKAGEKAGRKAGRKAGGARGARAGAAAGRKAGAAAGSRAGRRAGAKVSTRAAKRAGARAGKRAGTRAGARAGRRAGRHAAQGPYCGTSVPLKADGTPWTCVLGDDFSGSSLNTSLWRVMTSDEFNFGARKDCFVDSPANVYVAAGALNLVARRERSQLRCHRGKGTYLTQYTAGMVSTYQKWAQAYGRFEFRARFPYSTQRGLQTSLWLWPQDATGAIWPVSGEIDVAEWYSQWPDLVIPFLHYAGLDGGKATNKTCYVDRVQDWHSYVLEWQPHSIKISYDGQVCLENDSVSAPFDKPYLMAMFGGFGLNKNAPTASTPALNRTQIAWVRVWS